MNIPRKYLTLYVIIGSIVLFSLRDALSLVHTALHAIPNPFHAHTFLPPLQIAEEHSHDEQTPHTHHHVREQTPESQHTVLDHVFHNKKTQPSQNDKEEAKPSAELTWDIQGLHSFQLFNLYQTKLANIFFTNEQSQLVPFYPPSPPPEFA